MSYQQPGDSVSLIGKVNGGDRVWRINNPLSDGALADAAASLGNDYHIYMTITRYVVKGWDDQIKDKNVIKIK